MACMGPSYSHAMNVGEEAFRDIIKLLEEKYGLLPEHIATSTIAKVLTEDGKPIDVGPFKKKMNEDWIEAKQQLLKAVQELVWCDHCASF